MADPNSTILPFPPVPFFICPYQTRQLDSQQKATMSDRGRSRSPKPVLPSPRRTRSASRDVSMSISRSRSRSPSPTAPQTNGSVAPVESGSKVVVVGGLTKNVHRGHLEEIFGEYGRVTGCDLPVFKVCELTAHLEQVKEVRRGD